MNMCLYNSLYSVSEFWTLYVLFPWQHCEAAHDVSVKTFSEIANLHFTQWSDITLLWLVDIDHVTLTAYTVLHCNSVLFIE